MFLKIIDDDPQRTVELMEVHFELGKYIRRKDDIKYLHVHKDDSLVDWADSSHTLNEWFEFIVEPGTHVIRTHRGKYLTWETEFGSLVQTEDPTRAIRMWSKPRKWTTMARENFDRAMESLVPDMTSKEKTRFLADMWKNMTTEEKRQYS